LKVNDFLLAHLLPTDADLLVDEVVCRLSIVNGSLKFIVILPLEEERVFPGPMSCCNHFSFWVKRSDFGVCFHVVAPKMSSWRKQ
jgi:hypothetical protein